MLQTAVVDLKHKSSRDESRIREHEQNGQWLVGDERVERHVDHRQSKNTDQKGSVGHCGNGGGGGGSVGNESGGGGGRWWLDERRGSRMCGGVGCCNSHWSGRVVLAAVVLW